MDIMLFVFVIFSFVSLLVIDKILFFYYYHSGLITKIEKIERQMILFKKREENLETQFSQLEKKVNF